MLCQSCFFFSNREKGKISISVSGFPNSKNEILYDVVNLVVPAPLPMESTVKLRSARAVGPVVLTGRRAQIPGWAAPQTSPQKPGCTSWMGRGAIAQWYSQKGAFCDHGEITLKQSPGIQKCKPSKSQVWPTSCPLLPWPSGLLRPLLAGLDANGTQAVGCMAAREPFALPVKPRGGPGTSDLQLVGSPPPRRPPWAEVTA